MKVLEFIHLIFSPPHQALSLLPFSLQLPDLDCDALFDESLNDFTCALLGRVEKSDETREHETLLQVLNLRSRDEERRGSEG